MHPPSVSPPRVLLCATDAGGGRNLAPLVPGLARRGAAVTLMTRPALRHLFDGPGMGGTSSAICRELPVDVAPGNDELAALLVDGNVDAVICGTTRYASPDRSLIRIGRRLGVPVTVVLDEWFAYRFRFEPPDGGAPVFPDAICVQDGAALAGAVAEGIPAPLCRITGSPALAALTDRAEELLDSPPPRPAILEGIEGRPVVTYLSETHANDYGGAPGERGPLGPFIGYTETSVLGEVRDALEQIGTPVVLVEKLHPAAPLRAPVSERGVPEQLTAPERSAPAEDGADASPATAVEPGPPPAAAGGPSVVEELAVRETDLWGLLWHSDLVIGMRSMALLEAAILGCEAVSFQPGLIGEERCTAVRLGAVEPVEREGLVARCERALAAEHGRARRTIRRFPFATAAAVDNVLGVALHGIETSGTEPS